MIKKANPTLEGQLLEYLESAPDGKSEVMWNVLQHLRARQRGEKIEHPTIEGQIAEFFETAPLEKAEVLFNIIELKLGKRLERDEEDPPAAGPAKAKKAKPEPKGRPKLSAASPAVAAAPAPREPESSRTLEPAIGPKVNEPVMVPVDEGEEMDRPADDLDDRPVMVDDVA